MIAFLKHTTEGAVFGGLAIAILLVGFISWPEKGMQSQGAGGASHVSITAASQAVTAIVQQWEQPVEAQTKLTSEIKQPEPAQRDLPQSLPDLTVAQNPAARLKIATPAKPDITSLEAAATKAPQVDRSQPAKPVKTDPTPPRPKAKKAAKQKRPSAKAQAASVKSAGGTAQTAAGVGGGAYAGHSAGSVTTQNASSAQNANLENIWSAQIKTKISRAQKYPRRGKGVAAVVVNVVVNENGRLQSYRIIRSSGQQVFDRAAVRAIKSIRRYPKAPSGYTGGQASFNTTLIFQR